MFKNLNVKQIERILMLALIGFFGFWMLRQCATAANSDKMQRIDNVQPNPAQPQADNNNTQPQNTQVTNSNVRRDTIVRTQYVQRPTALFVWADGLKVRVEPYLTSAIVVSLPLNTQVSFEGETSSFKQKIKMDNIEYNERWLKVKTTDGKVGWVYGGGIRLYQK
ncbi:MAG: SH3 domain-containing protein [Saprospiraceae bacterium]